MPRRGAAFRGGYGLRQLNGEEPCLGSHIVHFRQCPRFKAIPGTRQFAPLPGKGRGLESVYEREYLIKECCRVAACHVGAKAERHAAPSPAPEIESGTVDVYHADGHAPAAFGGNIYNGCLLHI